MAESSSVMLSNKVIGLIALVLAVGIMLDGKLYNRTPKVTGIFAQTNPTHISISQQQQLIMAFENNNKQWVMTEPADAPLNAERIQVLLDTNYQVSRSYKSAELPLADLFPNPVTIDIDGNVFHLGEIEPVSKLRYVRANDQVYLQADHVIPMIQAGASAFLNLALTKSVSTVEINQHLIDSPDSWSSLNALGIVPRSKLDTAPLTSITVTQKNKDNKTFNLHVQNGSVILASPAESYGYLISQQQAEQLGLATYL